MMRATIPAAISGLSMTRLTNHLTNPAKMLMAVGWGELEACPDANGGCAGGDKDGCSAVTVFANNAKQQNRDT